MSETSSEPQYILEKIHLIGFKSIVDLDIDLKKGFNILIGENDTGKSNFLEILNELNSYPYFSIPGEKLLLFNYAKLDFVNADRDILVYEMAHNNRRSNKKQRHVSFLQLENEELKVHGELVFENHSQELIRKNFTINKSDAFGEREDRFSIFKGLGYGLFVPFYINFTLPEELTYVASPGVICIPMLLESETFESDFSESTFLSGLFSKLTDNFSDIFKGVNNEVFKESNLVRERQDNQYNFHNAIKKGLLEKLVIDEEIIENLARFSPIKGVRFNKHINISSNDREITVDNLKLEYFIDGHWVLWGYLSGGSKRLFYLISEITYKKSGLILIDEPELGIHPLQFNLLMQFLKEQSQNKQFVISSHSPKILDHLTKDELDCILMTAYDAQRGTVMARLSNEQQLNIIDHLKKEGLLSDYWLAAGLSI